MPADIRQFLSKPAAERAPQPYSTAPQLNSGPSLVVLNETTEPLAEDSTPDTPQCTFECCDISTPQAARMTIDKSLTVQSDGKRKRYFHPDWLNQFKWLVVYKTTYKGYCLTCRYAVIMKLSTFSKKRRTNF